MINKILSDSGIKIKDLISDQGKPLTVDSNGNIVSTQWSITSSDVANISGQLQSQINSIDIKGDSGIQIVESPTNTFTVSISGSYASTVNLTAGNLPQFDGNNLQNSLITQTDNKIGIAKTPDGVQRVQVSGAIRADFGSESIPNDTLDTTTAFRMCGANSAFVRLIGDTWNSNTVIGGRRANGTRSSPTTVSSGSALISIAGYGYDGSSYTTSSNGSYVIYAKNTWSGTDRSTRHSFLGTPSGSTASSEWMRIEDGKVGIGFTTTPTYTLSVNGSIYTNNTIYSNLPDTTDPTVLLAINRGTLKGMTISTDGDGVSNLVAVQINSTDTFGIMRIEQSTGYIHLGSSITATQRLEVEGNVKVSGNFISSVNDQNILVSNISGGIVSSGIAVTDLATNATVEDVSGYLQNQIWNLIVDGAIDLNTTDDVYTVTHASRFNTHPVVTVVVPTSSSQLLIPNIYNVTGTGFNVVLSDVPSTTGYKLHYFLW
jgi:hypothetical protein